MSYMFLFLFEALAEALQRMASVRDTAWADSDSGDTGAKAWAAAALSGFMHYHAVGSAVVLCRCFDINIF